MNDWRWNLKAKHYRKVRSCFPLNLILKKENQNLERILNSLDIRNKKVIDLGTGIGNGLQTVATWNQVIGIDFSFSMLQAARQFYPYVHFIQADALKVPLKANSMDCVTAIGLSEYLRDTDSLLKESRRILKGDGFLVITFAPPGIWTRLRLLLGHSIFPRTLEDIITIAESKGLRLIKSSRSLMQGQVLFQKIYCV